MRQQKQRGDDVNGCEAFISMHRKQRQRHDQGRHYPIDWIYPSCAPPKIVDQPIRSSELVAVYEADDEAADHEEEIDTGMPERKYLGRHVTEILRGHEHPGGVIDDDQAGRQTPARLKCQQAGRANRCRSTQFFPPYFGSGPITGSRIRKPEFILTPACLR